MDMMNPPKTYNSKDMSMPASNRRVQMKLFTPGPLGISLSTKQAMLLDMGSRDTEFIKIIAYIREKLLEIAGVSGEKYTCIPIQGTGTYANEAVLQTTIPRTNARVLVIENGRYGERLTLACQYIGVEVHALKFPETLPVDPAKVEEFLQKDSKWTNIAVIHLETSTGILNPLEDIGKVVRKCVPEAVFLVDAISSFGAIPFDLQSTEADFMVSSSNKCLEGSPGFAYAIGKKDVLLKCKGQARSLCLDLFAQYEGLEKNGQFRFTPPTHAMLAFHQALVEFEEEGGVEGRSRRYKKNHSLLLSGMRKLNFKEMIKEEYCAYVITTFLYPDHPKWQFEDFHTRMNNHGQLLYPGKTTVTPSFRIGNIGHLFPKDIAHLLDVIEKVLDEMGISTMK